MRAYRNEKALLDINTDVNIELDRYTKIGKTQFISGEMWILKLYFL